jgi:hypothetical protein
MCCSDIRHQGWLRRGRPSGRRRRAPGRRRARRRQELLLLSGRAEGAALGRGASRRSAAAAAAARRKRTARRAAATAAVLANHTLHVVIRGNASSCQRSKATRALPLRMLGALLRCRSGAASRLLPASRRACAVPALQPRASEQARADAAAPPMAAAAADALEQEVGITSFANAAPGFTGVLKHRRALRCAGRCSVRCGAPR